MKQRVLFSFTIFLTSFLLFLVQPMMGKVILPHLGGSQNVWNVCLMFYQVTLLLGYVYAHYLRNNFDVKKQRYFHSFILALSLVLCFPSAINVGADVTASPVLSTLRILFSSIFIPFFVLSSCSPLLQSFFSTSSNYKRDNPYFLYRASNIGSFFALILYPFYLEAELSITRQRYLWCFLYFIAIALVFLRQKEADTHELKTEEIKPEPLKKKLLWIFLAFIPSSLMMGVTTKLTVDITPMPLLWAIPLGLYLLSFVISFSDFAVKCKKYISDLNFAFIAILVLFMASTKSHITAVLIFHLLAFFAIAVFSHLRLYENRPKSNNLTEFYLYLSIGGALGGIFNAFVFPLIFSSLFDYYLILLLAVFVRDYKKFDKKEILRLAFLLIIYILLFYLMSNRYKIPFFKETIMRYNRIDLFFTVTLFFLGLSFIFIKNNPVSTVVIFCIIFIFGNMYLGSSKNIVHKGRSFYSIYSVVKEDNSILALKNGNIYHGIADLSNPKLKASYYSEESPISSIFKISDKKNDNWNIALMGLGIGTASCYAKEGQNWDIFEIDEKIVDLSRKENIFPVLKTCKPDANIIIGDGRIEIAKQDKKYNLIIIDVFTSDAVPSHLLTKEAFLLYLSKLAPEGKILFHISNIFIDIEGIIYAVTKDLNLNALVKHVVDEASDNDNSWIYGSTWAVVSKSDISEYQEKEEFILLKENKNITNFSDESFSIFKALKPKFKLK